MKEKGPRELWSPSQNAGNLSNGNNHYSTPGFFVKIQWMMSEQSNINFKQTKILYLHVTKSLEIGFRHKHKNNPLKIIEDTV